MATLVNVIIIPRDVFASLDEFHQAIAIALEKKEKVRIIDQPAGGASP